MKLKTTKKLLEFTFLQMKKLDKKEINVETAYAQSKLIQQANNTIRLNFDIKRTKSFKVEVTEL